MLMPQIDHRPLAIFLMGPTASGKTALSLALAERFGLALVSADSALVYRGMDIGTAKPSRNILARFPHRLIDIREPQQAYSAAEFRTDALNAMTEITTAGQIPLLVGGTGLYFRALQSGLSTLPKANPEVRAQLQEEATLVGWHTLHARLTQLDPLAASRIKFTDAQRIQRALEVVLLTGLPISKQQGALPPLFPYRILKLALIPHERTLLHQRIVARLDAMLAEGFLEEVTRLRDQCQLDPALPAFRAVGYRQAWEYLAGKSTRNEFRNKVIFATRQLAKRQMTWLRSELDVRVLDSENQKTFDKAELGVECFLDTEPSCETSHNMSELLTGNVI